MNLKCVCFIKGHKEHAPSGECSRFRSTKKHGGVENTIVLLKRWIVAGLGMHEGHGRIKDLDVGDMPAEDLENVFVDPDMLDNPSVNRARLTERKRLRARQQEEEDADKKQRQ